jgi:hypothetical protein
MSYPVFIKRGDALAELQRILSRLRGSGGATDEALGLHKAMHVARAAQTVVMVTTPDAPLAARLRSTDGWAEPSDV